MSKRKQYAWMFQFAGTDKLCRRFVGSTRANLLKFAESSLSHPAIGKPVRVRITPAPKPKKRKKAK